MEAAIPKLFVYHFVIWGSLYLCPRNSLFDHQVKHLALQSAAKFSVENADLVSGEIPSIAENHNLHTILAANSVSTDRDSVQIGRKAVLRPTCKLSIRRQRKLTLASRMYPHTGPCYPITIPTANRGISFRYWLGTCSVLILRVILFERD